VEKTLLSFDQRTWTPTFDPEGDLPFTPELGREYYINNPGANFIVKRIDVDTYDVKIEIQSVANPLNAATFVPADIILRPQWEDSGNSSYQFITDPSSPNFLKLVYASVGSRDSSKNVNVGDVVTDGQWGLVAFVGDVNTGVQFNWDYPREGENFGSQQYLLNADGSYKMLEDPIRLAPLTLTNLAGEVRTLSLGFDGWLHGLPDLFEELRKNNFELTADVADKIIVVPAGTEVVDAADSSKHYLIKPLEISQFLAIIANPGGLELTAAQSIDLGTVPNFTEHNMGSMPNVPVKYSEGKPVQ
jgi:hypothetical protein